MNLPRIYRFIPKDELTRKGRLVKGLCDHDEQCIFINPRICDKERLITGVHEMLHYILPKANEKWVEKNCILVGEVLWRLGYRSPKHKWPTNSKNRSRRLKTSSSNTPPAHSRRETKAR